VNAARRKIAVVTGGRADFGHLARLAVAIEQAADLDLQLIVLGTHLSTRHGMTINEIEALGLPVAARVDMDMSSDTNGAAVRAVGTAILGLEDTLSYLQPDLLVLLGDRYEILAAASVALIMRIPIVHIHGGEVTTGAFDESIRHAVSKMASVHLVAAEPYRRRLIQMGEHPERVFNFGAPALETIRETRLLSWTSLEQALGFPLEKPVVAMTYHPATLGFLQPCDELDAILSALDRFPHVTVVMTGVNADPGSEAIRRRMSEWAVARGGKTHIVPSLGHLKYLSLLALADAMIGNSSSGYIEGPAFDLPVIDVGSRQTGRLAADCVVRVEADPERIATLVARALDADYRASLKGRVHPYEAGSFVGQTLDLLRTLSLGTELLRKPFYDLPQSAIQ
jgi:UDP-hydrolysing UDP-N-acetyl-D-glucosamine 2-epimerase